MQKKQSFNSIYYTLRDRTGTEELARGKPYCNDIFYKNLFMYIYLSYFYQTSNITVYVHWSELKQLNLFKNIVFTVMHLQWEARLLVKQAEPQH